mgnify:CR=1 FL=1
MDRESGARLPTGREGVVETAGVGNARPSEVVPALLGVHLDAAVPLVHERMNVLTEAVDMLRFLLVDDAEFEIDELDQDKFLDGPGLGGCPDQLPRHQRRDGHE